MYSCDLMYNWKNRFSNSVLEKSRNYLRNIRTIKEDAPLITATLKTSKIFKVSIIVDGDYLVSMDCSCSSNSNCIHEAALLYYIDEHIDDFKSINLYEQDLKKLVYSVDENSIRKFLLNQMSQDDNLKARFNDEYRAGKLIDKEFYFDKLDHILSSAEIGDFYIHESYNLDIVGNPLYDFMDEDVSKLIILEEDDLACELLNKLAFVLKDDYNDRSEYLIDCCEIFTENAIILLDREEASDENLDLLEKNFTTIPA